MTPEQAIEWIEDLRDGWKDKDNIEACNMAIKALKTEPCEDCISREETLEHIEACWINGRQLHHPELSEVKEWVKTLPSVTSTKSCTTTKSSTDDCISRDAVLREFTCLSDEAFVINRKIQEIVKKLPSIESERKPGKWIENDTIRQCNMCRALYPKGQRCGAYHYCPNCGVKMEVDNADSN